MTRGLASLAKSVDDRLRVPSDAIAGLRRSVESLAGDFRRALDDGDPGGYVVEAPAPMRVPDDADLARTPQRRRRAGGVRASVEDASLAFRRDLPLVWVVLTKNSLSRSNRSRFG